MLDQKLQRVQGSSRTSSYVLQPVQSRTPPQQFSLRTYVQPQILNHPFQDDKRLPSETYQARKGTTGMLSIQDIVHKFAPLPCVPFLVPTRGSSPSACSHQPHAPNRASEYCLVGLFAELEIWN